MGLTLRWLVEDPHGGASGSTCSHAGPPRGGGRGRTASSWWRVTVSDPPTSPTWWTTTTPRPGDHLAPLGFGGPNAAFAQLTTRHAWATGSLRPTTPGSPVAAGGPAGTPAPSTAT
ncbi:hypothetical protein HBB16_15860 [Pseudonocardia sp. MCCB 268]|nr:hypothetical protein [Pseudonocardia cytotoxica]